MLDHVITPQGLNPGYYQDRIKYLESMGVRALEEVKLFLKL